MDPSPKHPQCFFQLNKVNKLLPSWLSAFNVELCLIIPCYSGSEREKATHTQGNWAGHLSHRVTRETQTSAENCSDPPPTETTSTEVHHKDYYIEMNLNANSYSYFCICTAFQSRALSHANNTQLSSKIPCGLRDNWIYIDQATATTVRLARVASHPY